MSVLGKVIAGVVLAPIVIVVVGIGGCEARKAYYDWRVREMCARDGGVIVFQRVNLSKDQYEQLRGNSVGIPLPDAEERSRTPFFSTTKIEDLRPSNPKVYRRETTIIRRADGKVLSRQIQYGRIGGDFPTFAQPTSFGCSDIGLRLDIERQTFALKE